MKTVKKIGGLSAGYALAIAYALIGLFQGILIYLQFKSYDTASIAQNQTLAILSNFGAWIILIAPIAGLVIGFLAGIILAFVYNYIIVKIMGGIKLDIV